MRTSFPSIVPILGDQHAASKATKRLSACAGVASSGFRASVAQPPGAHDIAPQAPARACSQSSAGAYEASGGKIAQRVIVFTPVVGRR